MESFDVTNSNSSLYYNSASLAAAQAKANGAEKSEKKEKIKKGSFSSAMERGKMEASLLQEGFPMEIAGMDVEEALIYLKDQADMAADILRENQMPQYFADYRKKVSQFLRYLVKNNYEVNLYQKKGLNRKGRPFDPRVQVRIINEELDNIGKMFLQQHIEPFVMLSKIDEIKGMIVDLMAA